MLPQVGAAQRLLDAVQTAPEPHSAPPHLHAAELGVFPAELVQSTVVAQMQLILFPHGTVEPVFGLRERTYGGDASLKTHPLGCPLLSIGCWSTLAVVSCKLSLAAALEHIV